MFLLVAVLKTQSVIFDLTGARSGDDGHREGDNPSYQASSFDWLIKLLLALPQSLDDQ